MRIQTLVHQLAVACSIAVWLQACSVAPHKTIIEPPPKTSAKPALPLAPVTALKHRARSEQRTGHLAQAAATTERALRIDPDDPRLWQLLARIRLAQGDAAQAAAMAGKSNTLAGDNAVLMKQNEHIVAQALRLTGDEKDASRADRHVHGEAL